MAIAPALALAPPADAPAMPGARERKVWGLAFLIPYSIILAFFVVYPVCYGLWLGRNPRSYVELVKDPIFCRALFNTLVFLVVAINMKMAVALLLSGLLRPGALVDQWLSVLFILPWAMPSIPTILSIRFMLNPEWGLINHADLPAHGRSTGRTGSTSRRWRSADRDAGAHLEVAAVLDADPDRRTARDSGRAVRGRIGRRRHDLAEVPLHHLAVDAHALPHVARSCR